MAFLFKSKNRSQDRALSSREGPPVSGGTARLARDEKGQRGTPTGSLHSVDNDGSLGSPDQGYSRQRGQSVDQQVQPPPQLQQQQQQTSDLPLRNGPVAPAMTNPNPNPNASLYPWAQRRLTFTSSLPSPFPRYGAAVNSISSKEGDLYVMGGLINSTTVKGDLWMIEGGGSLACYPLATTAEGPGPRVGHASLLVGNAFIVYGGDTKIEETDVLDETLYLLNTSTRQWSRALPAGERPSGRYGHSLNLIGSKIYIFGGQVEGYFMNDLSAFDLNQLQAPNNRWEMLILNTDSGGPPVGKVPPARTNHTVVTFNDRLYLFGGTNGYQWFNDVWCYDPTANAWAQLDCIGYIPVPREGHAAALVDDVMYIFGGRTDTGEDLGDLAAFRITSRRWYTFQNMGPSPSPRSGHSMTTVGKAIYVVGGEPSQQTTTVNDLGMIYCLDTTKIRYPNDAQANAQKSAAVRRPSQSDVSVQNVSRGIHSREGSNGPPEKRAPSAGGSPMNNNHRFPNEATGPNGTPTGASKVSRAAAVPTGPPTAPPPGQPPQPTRAPRNASLERSDYQGSPVKQSPVMQQGPAFSEIDAVAASGRPTPTSQAAKSVPKPAEVSKAPGKPRSQGSLDGSADTVSKLAVTRPASPPPPTRQASNPVARRSSGRNSQTVTLLKELDAARNRNAWYASELELARKAGYVPNTSFGPILESRAAETFDDEDKPLIEALLAMRTELANVQNSVDKQAVLAAKQIAEVEKQRDAAIQEAVYAKAKLAARSNGSRGSPAMDSDKDTDERVEEIGRKLAMALQTQRDLQTQYEQLSAQMTAEKKARKLADDTVHAAQKRMIDLEGFKQQNSAELERLKAELHLAQREVREQSVVAAEATAALQLLQIEKDELERRSKEASSSNTDGSFEHLRQSVVAADEARTRAERRFEEERVQREMAEAKVAQFKAEHETKLGQLKAEHETKLNKLKAEHELRTAELETAQQRLREAEELAEQHANEAKTHRQAVLAGLEKISTRDVGSTSRSDSDRIVALQGQLNAAKALTRKYQQEADTASDRLRSAEERIAGLEVYQEQASREGVMIRRQLQNALRETQSLQAANSDLKKQLAAQQLETNAITVQHNTLKDILGERGISPTTASSARARGLGSPREGSPEQMRLRDLENQLSAAAAAHEETKAAAALQAHESESAYREKLGQLENDYQSAVHYVKGTEKMLQQLKEQLTRYKAENSKLKEQLVDMEDKKGAEASNGQTGANAAQAEWESERQQLQTRISGLQTEMQASAAQLEKQIQTIRQELTAAQHDRDQAAQSSEEAARKLEQSKRDLEQLQDENSQLERRAQDAESKVSSLLDQVEMSVDTYRRRSRHLPAGSVDISHNPDSNKAADGVRSAGGETTITGANGLGGGLGHSRNESTESESMYGAMSDARNSTALDTLANELDMLRSHWEATNKNYRLSNTFDFDPATVSAGGGATSGGSIGAGGAKKEGEENAGGIGLSESLADWRKRLDESHPDTPPSSGPGGAK